MESVGLNLCQPGQVRKKAAVTDDLRSTLLRLDIKNGQNDTGKQ